MSHLDEEEDEAGYHPSIKEGGAPYCFLNADRECGPACMAYQMPLENNPPSPSLSGEQNACALLVGVERLGRFMGGVYTLIKSSTGQERKARDDATRQQHPPPPNPMGS